MAKLREIPHAEFPMTVDRYRRLKDELRGIADAFTAVGHNPIALKAYKVEDALDNLMNAIREQELREA
jgi:hypothetical protein